MTTKHGIAIEGVDREWVLAEAVLLYREAIKGPVVKFDVAVRALGIVLGALPPEIPADLGEQLRRAFESGMQPEGPKPVP